MGQRRNHFLTVRTVTFIWSILCSNSLRSPEHKVMVPKETVKEGEKYNI